jgi:hypothetical protein
MKMPAQYRTGLSNTFDIFVVANSLGCRRRIL